MINYEALYKTLFNGMTDAIREMERQNYIEARACLMSAQLAAEEIFMAEDEEAETDDQSILASGRNAAL